MGNRSFEAKFYAPLYTPSAVLPLAGAKRILRFFADATSENTQSYRRIICARIEQVPPRDLTIPFQFSIPVHLGIPVHPISANYLLVMRQHFSDRALPIVVFFAGACLSISLDTTPQRAFAHEAEARKTTRCYEEILCVHEHTVDSNTTRVELTNHQTVELTVTFDVERENIVADQELPFTIVVHPKQTIDLTTLRRENVKRDARYVFRYRWQWGSAESAHTDSHVYRLPFPPGTTYRVSQSYEDPFSHGGKQAIDFAMPVGSPIHAARSGVVVALSDGSNRSGRSRAHQADANYLLLRHIDGTIGGYYHLAYRGVLVQLGQLVEAGELIARSGDTGFTTGPHLHFEVSSPIDGFHVQTYAVSFLTTEAAPLVPRKGAWVTAPGQQSEILPILESPAPDRSNSNLELAPVTVDEARREFPAAGSPRTENEIPERALIVD